MAASFFGGMFNAWNYAYGVNPGFPSPIRVDIGNGATGSGSVTLAFSYVTTQDGLNLANIIQTNTPITIGLGTNAETVTPSAVSYPNPNAYDGGTITATFSNLHGTGDLITSGTYGLQEAINAANAAGGGIVLVDAIWFANGGTNTILNAAVLPSNGSVSIQNTGAGGGASLTTTVTIANAEVKTLFSVGTQLLPAPGAGNAWVIDSMTVENVYLTAAFAAGGAIQASYGTGVTTPASATIAATFLTSPTANQMVTVAGAMASTLSSTVLNKAITLDAATADFTTGGGSLIVKLKYHLFTGF